MSEELKPCPFCGQQDAYVEQLDSDASVVICQGRVGEHSACLTRGPVGVQESDGEEHPGKDAAIREWNHRAVDADFDALQQRCRALEEQRARWASNAAELGGMCDALRAEVEQLRKDAERYRWLRDHWHGFEYLRSSPYPWVSLDQEVDRVMSKENSQ